MLRFASGIVCCLLFFACAIPPAVDSAPIEESPPTVSPQAYLEFIRRSNALLSNKNLTPATRSSALVSRGLARFRNSEPALAIPDYDEAIALDPTGPNAAIAYYDRGLALVTTGSPDRALSDFGTALQLNPSYAGVYDDRALLYLARNDFDSAIRDLNRAITLEPTSARHISDLAYAYMRQGDLVRAGAAVSRAIDVDPKSPSPYEMRADIAFVQGRYESAVSDYDRSLDFPRFFYGVYLKRGAAYLRLGNLSAAANDYRRAERYQPLAPPAAFSLGRVQLYTHDYAKADASFAYAFDHVRAPTVRAHVLIWRFLLAMRQGAKPGTQALAHAEDASAVSPTAWPGPVINMYVGRITPEQLLAAAQNTNPTTQRDQVCEANYYIGEYALALAQTARGITLLRLARATCPFNFFETDGAIMHLTELGG
jgi:tetratricopeptide (TPR) repeat protein